MRPDAMLLDEPSNHLDLESLIWLETSSGVMTAPDDDLARPRVHEPHRQQDRRDRWRSLTTYSGNYEFYRSSAR
jgi:hypothetical protein